MQHYQELEVTIQKAIDEASNSSELLPRCYKKLLLLLLLQDQSILI